MAYSWAFIWFIEGFFIGAMLLLTILIIRAKTPRRWIVEQITITDGKSLHEVVHINKYEDFDLIHNEKKIDPSLLYRMSRTWWKMAYYFLINIRGRFSIIYQDKLTDAIRFEASEVPASIIEITDKSTAYTSAVNSTFNRATKIKGLIWIFVAFIVIIALVFLIRTYGGNL